MSELYEIGVQTIDGQPTTLASYRGQVLLIVNVASACGLTPQYAGLQKLYSELGPQGFTVLGFPCNQFGAQEPGTEAEIQNFCSTRFAVKFPMFAKIDVNGPQTHPLYAFLKRERPGLEGKADIEWNFAKFLVDRKGQVTWSLDNADLPGPWLKDPCGAQRLANGNVVITSYGAGDQRVKLLEVDRRKRVVWTHEEARAGGIHHFQVLTTNGRKEPWPALR